MHILAYIYTNFVIVVTMTILLYCYAIFVILSSHWQAVVLFIYALTQFQSKTKEKQGQIPATAQL